MCINMQMYLDIISIYLSAESFVDCTAVFCVCVCLFVYASVCKYVYVCDSVCWLVAWYYLPTPPLGQDMTQGQFLSGV